MLPTRPPLLDLGGDDPEAGFKKAQEAFNDLYLSRVIVDIRGVRISFVRDDCGHVCFKERPGPKPPFKQAVRELWRPDRASRIPWIGVALTHPSTKVRPSPMPERGRFSYSIIVPADRPSGLDQEFFAAFVRPSDRPDELKFITAYSMDQASFQRVKDGGPTLYPVSANANKPKRRK